METQKKQIPHLHPMMVHFPQALFPVAFASLLVAVVTGNRLFESGALTAVAFGLLSSPPCILTGYIDWKLRYKGVMTPVFRIKSWGSVVLVSLATAALAVRLLHPEIAALEVGTWPFILYVSLLGVSTATCVVLGYYGGRLVFH